MFYAYICRRLSTATAAYLTVKVRGQYKSLIYKRRIEKKIEIESHRERRKNKESWFVLTRIRFWLKANGYTDALWSEWDEVSFSHFGPGSHFLSTFIWCWWSLVWFSSLRVAFARLSFFYSSFSLSIFFLLLLSAVIILHERSPFGAKVLLAFLGVYVWVFESTKINAFYFDKSTLRCQTISNMHTENKCYIVDFWQTEKPFRVERSHFSEINTEFKHIFSPTRRNIYSMCISIGK